jgi:hypothetical protein
VDAHGCKEHARNHLVILTSKIDVELAEKLFAPSKLGVVHRSFKVSGVVFSVVLHW